MVQFVTGSACSASNALATVVVSQLHVCETVVVLDI